MSAEKVRKSVRANKIAIILLTTIAAVIGIAPLIINIQRPQLLFYFGLIALIVAWLNSRSYETKATESPGFWDFVLGFLGAIAYPALVGFFWFVFYWLIYGLAGLLEWVISAVGFEVHFNLDLIAFWPTIIFFGFVAIVLVAGNEDTLLGIAAQHFGVLGINDYGRSEVIRDKGGEA